MKRRQFLSQMGWTSGILLGSQKLMGNAPPQARPGLFSPVKIRGRVLLDGRGVSGVAVSDGRSVIPTGKNGRFTLVSDKGQPFVFVSLPSNSAIPLDENGCARSFRAIDPKGKNVQDVRFDLDSASQSSEAHAFFALADPQTKNEMDLARFREEAVPDIRKTAQEQPTPGTFAAVCGDITYDNPEIIPAYLGLVSQCGIPFFHSAGNHDVNREVRTDSGSLRTFQSSYGPANYSFDRGEIHYIVLDDVFWFKEYFGYVNRQQLDWLAADLALVEPGRNVVIFVHIAPYCLMHERNGLHAPEPGVVVVNREALYDVLKNHTVTFVCGHNHESEYLHDGGTRINIGGAVCGAWWTAPICADGTPNGYTIYQAKGSELRWTYKSTGLPLSHQMRLYPPGSHPQLEKAVMANIWAVDEDWTVRWYENGQNRGSMLRQVARDPLAIELFEGKDRPNRRQWIEPVPADHFFFAQPSPEAREIVVEAQDRWGHEYSEKLVL